MQRNQDRNGNTSSSHPVGGDSSWMNERRPSRGVCGDGRRLLLRRLNRIRVLCGRFINNSRVQLVVVALIGVNAIIMGIGTFDFVTDDPVVEQRFQQVDQAFLIIFTVELCFQLVYHGLRLFLDRWLVFDLIIVVASWAFKEAQVMRAFRIFRALRLITRIDTMRNLVKALFATTTSMIGIGLLLLLVTYIFSVMFTQLFKSLYKDGQTQYNYFSRLDTSFFTCFQFMTFDNWGDVCKEVQEVYWWAWIPIIVYIIIAGFAIVNLIVAVICDAMAAMHEDDKAKLMGRAVADDSFESIGDDSDFDGEGEEMKEEEQGWDRDSSANDSWEGEGALSEGSRSKSSFANVTAHLVELQGEVEETMQVQKRTMTAIQYLTQELEKVPTPDR